MFSMTPCPSECRHTEDKDLASINYLHYGAPKMWYCIPPKDRKKFEDLLAAEYRAEFMKCKEYPRHKVSWRNTVLAPGFGERHCCGQGVLNGVASWTGDSCQPKVSE